MNQDSTTITTEIVGDQIETTEIIITYMSKDAKISEILRLRNNANATITSATSDVAIYNQQLSDLGYTG